MDTMMTQFSAQWLRRINDQSECVLQRQLMMIGCDWLPRKRTRATDVKSSRQFGHFSRRFGELTAAFSVTEKYKNKNYK